MKPNEPLAIYMNDQLALGIVWREVARRAQRRHVGTPLGDALARVADAVAEDVRTFEDIMTRLGIRRSAVKPALAIAAERVGRLKPNGHLVQHAPLSDFVELDVLATGLDAKRLLWSNLRDLADVPRRLPEIDFDRLITRAKEQRALIEPFRSRCGAEVFAA